MSNLKIIIVGGMIGVGKTSLIRNLCEQLKNKGLNVNVVYELFEECEDNVFQQKNTYDEFMNTIIELYYDNIDILSKEKNSENIEFLLHKLLSHQVHFLSTRTTKVFTAINLAKENKLDYLILDRSLYEDIVFTYLNLKTNEKLWNKYYEIWELWESNLSHILNSYQTKHLILDAPIDVILQRIEKRGREFEQGEKITKYFKELNSHYVDQILSEFSKKNIRNYEIIDTEHDTSEKLAQKIRNII